MKYICNFNGNNFATLKSKDAAINKLFGEACNRGYVNREWDKKEVVTKALNKRGYYLFGYSSTYAEIVEVED